MIVNLQKSGLIVETAPGNSNKVNSESSDKTGLNVETMQMGNKLAVETEAAMGLLLLSSPNRDSDKEEKIL